MNQARANNLKAYIYLSGHTVKSMAEAIGVSRPYLSNIIHGRESASERVVGLICDTLDVSRPKVFRRVKSAH